MAPPNYRLRIDDRSPGRRGFSFDGGKLTDVFLLEGDELVEAVVDILGTTERGTDRDRRLRRKLPKAHPEFPWMTASAITSIQGLGPGERIEANQTLEVAPIMSHFFNYQEYALTVEFSHQPWAIIPDDQIVAETITYPDYNDPAGERTVDRQVYPEWIRFTDWIYEPGLDQAYAQHGMLRFRRGDGSAHGSPEPHLYTCSGFPRTPIPKTMIRFLWMGVPYDYLTHPNSLLIRHQGKINSIDWYSFEKGSLLYHGPRIVKRYTPPVPQLDPWAFTRTAFSTRKLVDLELIFERTFRECPSAPEPSNKNYIAAGHNLFPWYGSPGKFFYAETATATPAPPLQAFPFQLLFMDPES